MNLLKHKYEYYLIKLSKKIREKGWGKGRSVGKKGIDKFL